jgi:tRNA dimethylallyltransferase
MDSMQVYRGFPIASAQPTPEERARVPHHLFECVELDEHFDAGRYVERAVATVQDLEAQGRRALFVGGTALYYRALTEGLADLPPRDPALRAELRGAWDADEGEALRRELAVVDPVTAARLGPADYRRHERALEVHRLTGRPLSELQEEPVEAPLAVSGALALRPPREWVRERVARRWSAMREAGLLEELRTVHARFRDHEELPPSLQAIGYRPLAAAFEGEADLEEALSRMLSHTNRLVRHQDTWLRKLGLEELDPSQGEPAALCEAAAALLGLDARTRG